MVPLTARRRASVLGARVVLSALAVKAIVATMSVTAAWVLVVVGVVAGISTSMRGFVTPGFRIDDEALDHELRAFLDDVA